MRSIMSVQLLIVALLAASCNSRSVAPQPSDSTGKSGEGQLPPAIVSGHTYRCEDNKILRIDYFQGNRGALLQDAGDLQVRALTAADKGSALTADGYVVIGRGPYIRFQRPGGPLQHCKG